MNQSRRIMRVLEQKEVEFRKGDEVKVNVGALKDMPEPQLNIVKNVIKKAEGKPVVIRVASDSLDIAESPMAGATIGTVQVPKSAVSKVGGAKEHDDERMDVDAKDQIKPVGKPIDKGESLATQLMGILK